MTEAVAADKRRMRTETQIRAAIPAPAGCRELWFSIDKDNHVQWWVAEIVAFGERWSRGVPYWYPSGRSAGDPKPWRRDAWVPLRLDNELCILDADDDSDQRATVLSPTESVDDAKTWEVVTAHVAEYRAAHKKPKPEGDPI
jgi:hypothetical protein